MSTEQSTATGQRKVAKTEGLRRVREDKVNLMHTDDYVCIESSTPLHQAIEVMKQDEGGCAIVCDGDRVVGIFTERDLLTKIIGEEIDPNASVSNWMSPAVSTLTPDATIGRPAVIASSPAGCNAILERRLRKWGEAMQAKDVLAAARAAKLPKLLTATLTGRSPPDLPAACTVHAAVQPSDSVS